MAKQAHHRQGCSASAPPGRTPEPTRTASRSCTRRFRWRSPFRRMCSSSSSRSDRVTMVWGGKGIHALAVHQIAHRGIRQLGQQQLPLRRGVKGRTATDLRCHLDPRAADPLVDDHDVAALHAGEQGRILSLLGQPLQMGTGAAGDLPTQRTHRSPTRTALSPSSTGHPTPAGCSRSSAGWPAASGWCSWGSRRPDSAPEGSWGPGSGSAAPAAPVPCPATARFPFPAASYVLLPPGDGPKVRLSRQAAGQPSLHRRRWWHLVVPLPRHRRPGCSPPAPPASPDDSGSRPPRHSAHGAAAAAAHSPGPVRGGGVRGSCSPACGTAWDSGTGGCASPPSSISLKSVTISNQRYSRPASS